MVGSRRRGFAPLLAAGALAAWISDGGPAQARSRTQFYFRVDLATFAVTPLREVDVGDPAPRAKTTAGWWKPTPSGRKPEIRIKTLDKNPFTRFAHPNTLAVIADGEEQLRLPSPARTGDLLWYLVQNDVLVLGWRTSNGHDGMSELSGPEQTWGVDLVRGRVRWKRTALEKTNYALPAGDDRIVVYGRQTFQGVESATGKVLWRLPRAADDYAPLPKVCVASPALSILATTEVVGVDPAGKVAWRRSLGPGSANWCFVTGDRVLVAWLRPRESVLAALDAADGRVLWEKVVKDALSEPTAVGGELAIGLTADLARLDPTDGRIIWRLPGVPFTTVQRLSDGDWFLPEGGCSRVDARTGQVRWKLGQRCVRQDEKLLLTATVEPGDHEHATVRLETYSFSNQQRLRQDVVQRYDHFYDEGGAGVIDAYGGFAFVGSEWIVLD